MGDVLTQESINKGSSNAEAFGRKLGKIWATKWFRYTFIVLILFWIASSFLSKKEYSNTHTLTTSTPIATAKKPLTSEQFRSMAKERLSAIEHRIKENREHMRKFYATRDQIQKSNDDYIQLALIVGQSEVTKDKADLAIAQRAKTLTSQVAEQTRGLYASMIEEIFISSGVDATVRATGAKREQLTIRYALMSQPLVYKFQNEMSLSEQAKTYEFKKLVYTNGFEGSLRRTWTINL